MPLTKGKSRSYEQSTWTCNPQGIETTIKSSQAKTTRKIVLAQNSTGFQTRDNFNTLHNVPQSRNRGNISKFFLLGHSHSDTQTTQSLNKERKLLTSFLQELRYKNNQLKFTNCIQGHIKKIMHHILVGFIPEKIG